MDSDIQDIFDETMSYAHAGIRNSKREQDLFRQLRKVPEEDKNKFLFELLKRSEVRGLNFFRNCSDSSTLAGKVLLLGLSKAQVSGMRNWLPPVMPILGIRRMLDIMEDSIAIYPSGISLALHWLSSPRNSFDEESNDKIQELRTVLSHS